MALRCLPRLGAGIASTFALASLVLVLVPYDPDKSEVGQTLQMVPSTSGNGTTVSSSHLSRIHAQLSRISGQKKGTGTRLVALGFAVLGSSAAAAILFREKCQNAREVLILSQPCESDTHAGWTLCFTLLVDLLPNGFLPLPYLAQGLPIGAVCSLVLIFGGLAAVTMILIQRAANFTQQQDFSGIALIALPTLKVPMLIRGITRLIVFMMSLNCFGNLVCYLGFASDIFKEMAEHNLGLPLPVATLRNIGILTSAALLAPFCMRKTLADIFALNVFGAFAVTYSLVAMLIRWSDGSYTPRGAFYDAVLHPEHTEEIPWLSGKNGPVVWCLSLEFINGLTVAYLSHYNAPLYGRESGSQDVYEKVVLSSFAFCALFYCMVLLVVHNTFGAASDGSLQSTILNSYSQQDPLLQMARISVGLSILTSFPVMFYGLRESVFQLFAPLELPDKLPCASSELKVDSTGGSGDTQESTWSWQNSVLTVFALISVICCTVVFDDISVIVSFCGQVSGCVLVYLVPAALFLAVTLQKCTCCGDSGFISEHVEEGDADLQSDGDSSSLVTSPMIVLAVIAGVLGLVLSGFGLVKAIAGCI